MAMGVRGEQPSNDDMVMESRGKELTLDFSTTLVRDEKRKTQAIVHTFRDVTERRRLETHLRQALGNQPPVKEEPPESAGQLTAREKEILKLLASGLSTSEMAKLLSISRATVRNHVQNTLTKLGVHSKLEAVVLAQRCHLT
jgi:DNA-binding CsgD family transcriptional regulator